MDSVRSELLFWKDLSLANWEPGCGHREVPVRGLQTIRVNWMDDTKAWLFKYCKLNCTLYSSFIQCPMKWKKQTLFRCCFWTTMLTEQKWWDTFPAGTRDSRGICICVCSVYTATQTIPNSFSTGTFSPGFSVLLAVQRGSFCMRSEEQKILN